MTRNSATRDGTGRAGPNGKETPESGTTDCARDCANTDNATTGSGTAGSKAASDGTAGNGTAESCCPAGEGPADANAGRARHEGGKPGRRRSHGTRAVRIPHPGLYAAIDLGTNNCRMLIAYAVAHDRFRVVDAFSRVVRLGDDLLHLGMISDVAADRAISALGVCADRLSRFDVHRVRSVATEACRSARNGLDFVGRVYQETGIALDVITPAQEARLAVLGCEALIDRRIPRTLVFDIGGGSTEVAVLERSTDPDAPAASPPREGGRHGYPPHPGKGAPRFSPAGGRFPCCQRVEAWISVPWGVASLTSAEVPDAGSPDSRRAVYERMLERVQTGLQPLEPHIRRGMQFVGTSGTVTTLASLSMGLEKYDRRRVDGALVATESLVTLGRELAGKSVAERAAIPGVGEDRAELIVAGAAILEALVGMAGAEHLKVADRGIREGILRGLIARDMGLPVSAWVR